MVLVFDKNIDSNISSIDCGDVSADLFNWCLTSVPSYIMDRSTFKIKIGAIDTTIVFNSLEAMSPYIDAYNSFVTLQNPYVKVIDDPFYDKVPTGEIQSHSYVDTDIEKDLINGGN